MLDLSGKKDRAGSSDLKTNNNETNENSNKFELSSQDIGPSKTLVDLVSEIFKLSENRRWVRKQIYSHLQRFTKSLTNGKMNINQRLNQPIYDFVKTHVTCYEKILDVIEKMLVKYWPNGEKFRSDPQPRTSDEELRTLAIVKSKVLNEIPENIKLILGSKECRDAAIQFIKIFQSEDHNLELLTDFLDSIFEVMWPEID